MKNGLSIIGSTGQWVSACFLAVGVVTEIKLGANFGYICITIGSLLFAIFTKVKYYKGNPRSDKIQETKEVKKDG